MCTVLSCLAAHASVLHSDGIKRYPLGDKQFGVFEYRRVGSHALGAHAGNRWRFPHSRWNEVRTAELASCGYTVLGLSEDAGVDLFVKKKRNSLFVYFQGHPEYETLTLLKEYRRDTRRFLQGITETYPSMPEGYLNAAATGLLNEFQRHALMNRLGKCPGRFPASCRCKCPQKYLAPVGHPDIPQLAAVCDIAEGQRVGLHRCICREVYTVCLCEWRNRIVHSNA